MLVSLVFWIAAFDVGASFPAIDTRDLADRARVLPSVRPGASHALIMVAMTRESQKACDSWFEVMRDFPVVEPVELAIFPSGIRFLRGAIEPGMRRKIPVARHTSVLTHWGDRDDYVKALDIDDSDTLTVFLVDAAGFVRLRTKGEPTIASMALLRAALARAK